MSINSVCEISLRPLVVLVVYAKNELLKNYNRIRSSWEQNMDVLFIALLAPVWMDGTTSNAVIIYIRTCNESTQNKFRSISIAWNRLDSVSFFQFNEAIVQNERFLLLSVVLDREMVVISMKWHFLMQKFYEILFVDQRKKVPETKWANQCRTMRK